MINKVDIVHYACKFDYLLGSALVNLSVDNYLSAIADIRAHISGKSLPRPKPVTVKASDKVVTVQVFNLGCALRHIFAYSRNQNKHELKVAISYLLREVEYIRANNPLS